MHHDTASAHLPSRQLFEQHSPSAEQVLPEVLQLSFSAAHLPALQVPLQHCVSVLQSCASDTQAAAEHLPLVQLRLQHSVEVLQAALVPPHVSSDVSQRCVDALQICEQHCAPSLQMSL